MHRNLLYMAAMAILMTGCTAEWIIPEDYYVSCDDDTDCPDSADCMPTEEDPNDRVCVTQGRAECGNGVQEAGEACDDGDQASDTYQLNKTCNTSCTDYGDHCGDGFINGDEDCDDGNQEDDGNGCSATCTQCGSIEQCPQSGEVRCGDNKVHTAFETCDDGNSETEACPYGTPLCYVCNASCQAQDKIGAYCGDGIVQQRGLEGGTTLYTGQPSDGVDTGEWEGCDPGTEENPTPAVTCSSLHPALGEGMATCAAGCLKYDTQGCSNQDVVYVPAGPFMMGCKTILDADCAANEGPYHEVYLDAYVIDKTEVTVGAYRPWCEATESCEFKEAHERYVEEYDWYNQYGNYEHSNGAHPMNTVNHGDATQYCMAHNMRLPTEAEWEKAARGVDGRVYPWGGGALPTCQRAVMNGFYEHPDFGWIYGYGCGLDETWLVGSIVVGASPYGAMDMSGNLWEWVADRYGENYYNETPYENPQGPLSGEEYVLRGGSYTTALFNLRTSVRIGSNPDYRFHYRGFRCAQ